MTEPRSAAQEAGDPSTSPQRLLELTEKHPQLHRLIVLNPSCPEVARQWILATNPWAQRAYQASFEDGPADTEDAAAVSVWGDLGTAGSAEPAPSDGPVDSSSSSDGAPTSSVRIAQNAPVVPLGPSTPDAAPDPSPAAQPAPEPTPAAPASPAPAAPVAAAAQAPWTYDAPPAPGAYGPAAQGGPYAAGAQPVGGEQSAAEPAPGPQPAHGAVAGATSAADPEQGDGSGSKRRAWYACGGCLLLALILVIVMALVGRAWLSGDEEEYQRDSSTTATEQSPTEQPSEEPTEQETPDPVSPAPDGAHEMTELRSPTGNISCLLEEESVACSLVDRDFSEAGLEDCEDGPFSIQVAEGEAGRACGTSFLTESGTTLEYDESATYGDMACTSRFDGMTCWNTITGKGFTVNRVTYEAF